MLKCGKKGNQISTSASLSLSLPLSLPLSSLVYVSTYRWLINRSSLSYICAGRVKQWTSSSGQFYGLQTLADPDGEKLWKKLYYR